MQEKAGMERKEKVGYRSRMKFSNLASGSTNVRGKPIHHLYFIFFLYYIYM